MKVAHKIIILTLILALVLSACATPQATAPEEVTTGEAVEAPTEAPVATEAPAATEEQEEPPAPTEAAATEIVLEFPSWQWGQPGYEDFFYEAITEFESTHPGVTIEPVPVAIADYADYHVGRFAAGDPAEIVQFTLFDFNQFAAAGWLEPLDERLGSTDIPENWATWLLEAGQVDDVTYGLYISGFSQGLFYNRAMLEEEGLDVPQTPEELLEAAEALTKDTDGDGVIDQFGFSMVSQPIPHIRSYALLNFYVGLCGNMATAGQPTATSEEVVNGVRMMEEFFDAGVVPEGIDRIGARQYFWEGNAAMLIEGPWIMASVQSENPDLMPDVGVAPIPFPCQVAGPSNGFAIAKDQEHKDLAWEWIQLITSPEWMGKYAELTGIIPGRMGSITDETLAESPWMADFDQWMAEGRNSQPEGMEVFTNEIDQIFADNLADVFFGDQPAEEALEEIQNEMEALLEE